jgi:GNAT superfamily N-acetyltransferase
MPMRRNDRGTRTGYDPQFLPEGSMDIDIRSAGAADVPGLAALSAALFAEDGATRDRLRHAGWPRDNGRAWIEGLLAAQDALVLVAADRDGNAVGHLIGQFYAISAMWTGARTGLVSTYVAPEFRGRGVGGRLVEAFFAWSRELSVSTFPPTPPMNPRSASTPPRLRAAVGGTSRRRLAWRARALTARPGSLGDRARDSGQEVRPPPRHHSAE